MRDKDRHFRPSRLSTLNSQLPLTFFPPSPPKIFGDWPWEVVSSYSSATAPDLHGISRADPLFQARKELRSTTTALRFSAQDLFICRANFSLCPHPILLSISSSPAARVSSAQI